MSSVQGSAAQSNNTVASAAQDAMMAQGTSRQKAAADQVAGQEVLSQEMRGQNAADLRYLELLAEHYPSASKVSAELATLQAKLALPKQTEYFVSDIHGEYDAFSHIVRSGSGNIKRLIDAVLAEVPESERHTLATLIYYPEEKLSLVAASLQEEALVAWQATTMTQLVMLAACAAATRTHDELGQLVQAVAPDFSSVIEELLRTTDGCATGSCVADAGAGRSCNNGFPVSGAGASAAGTSYQATLIASVVRTGAAESLIKALCQLIQRLVVAHIHVVGDIYDRGPYPETIMDALMSYPSVDIQWGNHDIVWMGASLGQRGCIAHVVRNCARYGNLSILEDSYGINVRPLASFALEAYRDDPCVAFGLKGNPGLSAEELDLAIKIQKAMAIIQFKVEAQLIDENPSFDLEDRKLLHRIDRTKNTVVVDGIEYELTDTVFPTVDWDNPYQLTPAEEAVMQHLEQAFVGCEKLQRHMKFFLEKGSLYAISNGFLMFHACVPLNPDGSLMETNIYGTTYKGHALYEVVDRYVKAAFYSDDADMRKRGQDMLWYLWLGQGSPLFAKSKMATFELYLIADKAARKEVKNSFYSLLEDEQVLARIFEDFGLDPATSHIVCGHTPVKVKDGEDPVKCGGKAFIIDGGMSAAYQSTTGIAGFTLVANADSLALDSHQPLAPHADVVEHDVDMVSQRRVVEQREEPVTVADTDQGAAMQARVRELECLLDAYRTGRLTEKK